MAELIDKLLKAEALEGAQEDPFAPAVGPTPDCFSSNDVVRMFRLGASERDVDHIGLCGFCHERVEAFASVVGRQLAPSSSSWLSDMWGRIRSVQPGVPVGAHALVRVASACAVTGSRIVEPVRVQLVAGQVRKLHNVRVTVAGAISGEVVGWSSGAERFPVVEVRGVQASGDVLEALRHHKRITEKVVIEFGDTAEGGARVTATANVEFTRAGSQV